jgi:hypothetical protein
MYFFRVKHWGKNPIAIFIIKRKEALQENKMYKVYRKKEKDKKKVRKKKKEKEKKLDYTTKKEI